MKEELLKIKKFFQDHQLGIGIVFILSFLVYGFKLTHYSISIDTEALLASNRGMLLSWVGINRPMLLVLKYLFHLNSFNPFLIESLTYLNFTMFSIMLYYLFYRFKPEKNNLKLVLFSGLLVSSATYIEQLNFTLQSAEVSFCFLVMIFGLLCFNIGFEKNKYYYLGTVVSLIITFLSYQSFVPMYLTLICLLLFIKAKTEEVTFKELARYLFNAFLFLAIGLIFYKVLGALAQEILHVQPADYLTQKIKWFDEPLLVTIKHVLKLIVNGYFGFINDKTLFFSYINTVVLFLFVVNIWHSFKETKSKPFLNTILTITVILVPYSLTILLGDVELYRAMLSLPIVISFGTCFLFEDYGKFKYPVYVLLLSCMWYQLTSTSELVKSDYFRYVYDVSYASTLYNKLSSYSIDTKPVVMLGHKEATSSLIKSRGEVMGHSFFLWDQYEVHGVGVRASHFMQSLGYNIITNSEEDYKASLPYQESMQVFPNDGSIIETDNLIIVRLS